MKIKELIEKLGQYDPEMEVIYVDYFGEDPDFTNMEIETWEEYGTFLKIGSETA